MTFTAAPGRLDAVLSALSGASRSQVAGWIAGAHVQVDGVTGTKASQKLRGGEVLSVRPPPPPDAAVQLAQLISRRSTGLRYAGLHAYHGAAQHLRTWIKHSPVVKPGSIMPRYDGGDYMVNGKTQKGGTLTDAEIDDISAYLRSLKLPEEADYWRDTPVINTLNGGTQ